MKQVFKVMSFVSNEPVVENFSSYESADDYIMSRQHPDDYYVAWDEVTEEEYKKIEFND